jgi:hypothetical protein
VCVEEKIRYIFQELFWNKEVNRVYIVDFYIKSKKMIFEIDGESHGKIEQKVDDGIRDLWFKKKGIKVVRIQNEKTKDVEYLMELIYGEFSKRGTKSKTVSRNEDILSRSVREVDSDGKVVIMLPEYTEKMSKSLGKRKRRRSKGKKETIRTEPPGSFVGSVYWKG